jgi:lipopolysaccharide heptosyltransferase I
VPHFDANRICIVRLGAMGDVINTLPALDALRAAYPDAHLAWLVEEPWDRLLPRPPRLDEVIAVPRKDWTARVRGGSLIGTLTGGVLPFARELRERRFDLAIDFHGNLRSGVATRATRAPVRVGFAPGFCKEMNYAFTNRHYPVGGGTMHRIDRSLALCQAIGVFPVADIPSLGIRADAADRARGVFAEAGLDARPAVALHPGTSRFGEYKRWPPGRFAEIVRRLDERGVGSLITWGPGEEPLALAASDGTSATLSPKTTLPELAALLNLCDAFVGSDTGPGILAAAVDTPTVSIFGPKNPAVYAPRHRRARVVEVPMDCRPCRKRTCGDPKCMLHVTVDHVAEAVFALLDEMEGN